MNTNRVAWVTRMSLLACALALAGCAGAPMKLTQDDGRVLQSGLLREVYAIQQFHSTQRSAVLETARLNDPDCTKVWELPLDFESSLGKPEPVRIAFLRYMNMDERLTVLGNEGVPGVVVGDKVVQVNDVISEQPQRLAKEMISNRNDGKPFVMKTASGATATITPFQVCRGYSAIAAAESFGLDAESHPVELYFEELTADEVLWIQLWDQGLSEQAGLKMRAYALGSGVASGFLGLAVNSIGVGAGVAAGNAAIAAGATATKVIATKMTEAALEKAGPLQVAGIIGVPRATYTGMNWVASTEFDSADAWTARNIQKLGHDGQAGLTLSDKLVAHGLVHSSFVLQPERRAKLEAIVGPVLPTAEARAAPVSEPIEIKPLAEIEPIVELAASPSSPPAVAPAEALAQVGSLR